MDKIGTKIRAERFNTLLDRKKNEDELDRLVERWTRQRSPEEVMTLMQTADDYEWCYSWLQMPPYT